MILHLITDDKFTNYVIQQFDKKEMLSDFVLISSTQNLNYIVNIGKISFVDPNSESELHCLLHKINEYKSVVFHGLFYPWQEWLLKRWPDGVKIAWVCWGGEIYSQPDIYTSFFKPFTKSIYFLRKIYKFNKTNQSIFPKSLLSTIDYCLTNVEEEYDYVKKYLQNDIKLIIYSYYNINDTLGPLKDSRCKGKNVFLGNSAAIENNHIDIMLQLKRLDLQNRKVIMPLSYGSPWVRNLCVRFGKMLFKDNFYPMTKFMQLEAYNSIMLDCSVMIQSHLRENAHGNIVTGLWLGMKVYLCENSFYYKRFKKMGCIIFNIEKDLKKSNPIALEPLTYEEVEHNRNILLNSYGSDITIKNLSNMVNLLS